MYIVAQGRKGFQVINRSLVFLRFSLNLEVFCVEKCDFLFVLVFDMEMRFLVLSILLLVTPGYPLQCYRCSGSSRNGEKADKACVYGYSNVERQKCPFDHVCSTYQYEISIHGLVKSSVTIRGCQPYELMEDCDDLLDEIRYLVRPARVRQMKCMSCNSDLCNSI